MLPALASALAIISRESDVQTALASLWQEESRRAYDAEDAVKREQECAARSAALAWAVGYINTALGLALTPVTKVPESWGEEPELQEKARGMTPEEMAECAAFDAAKEIERKGDVA